MRELWEQWLETYGPRATTNAILEFLPKLIAAVLVALFFWVLWKILLRGVRFVMRKAELDRTLAALVETIMQYTVVIIAILTVLGQLGVNVTAVLTSLGVVGLTIGFAAKDALSNLISGLFILWDRPFVIGDLVEIDGKYGRVENITLRSTRVVTVDGKMLAFPNSSVVNSTVTSYTNFPHLRLDVEVTVGVNEDLARIESLFLEEIDGKAQYMDTPAPGMVVKALNDYNVLLEFRVWLDDEKSHVSERFALRRRLFERFTREEVDMPLETLQLAPFAMVTSKPDVTPEAV